MKNEPYRIDEDDDLDLVDMDALNIPREARERMIEGGLQMMRDHNYQISDWLLRLCDDYVEGRITFAQLNRRVMHDQLH